MEEEKKSQSPSQKNPPPGTRSPAALPRPPAAADPNRTTGGILGAFDSYRAISILHVAALGFLTFNSAISVYRARNDPWTVSFIVSAYVTMMLFFWCLRAYEKASPAGKRHLKIPIWMLALALNLMFAYKVAAMMPFGFAVAIWTMAGVTTLAGFYAFFICDDAHPVTASGPPEGRKTADGNKIEKHQLP